MLRRAYLRRFAGVGAGYCGLHNVDGVGKEPHGDEICVTVQTIV